MGDMADDLEHQEIMDSMKAADTTGFFKPRATALCDVCQKRPGTHTVMAAGTETWACDHCSGAPHACPACNRDCYCDGGDTLNCAHECPEDFDDQDDDE